MQECSEKKLTAKQKKAIQMLIYDGLKKCEVAEKLNIDPHTVSRWLNPDITPAFVDAYDKELEKAASDRQRRYKSAAQKAVDKLVELLDSYNPNTALAACKDILDRAGDKQDISVSVNTSSKFSDIVSQLKGGGLDE